MPNLTELMYRLCVVYQVVNMLVNFEPATKCDLHQTGLLLAPLPAKKPLWEAADESAWRREQEGEIGRYGLATNGDLVRVNDARYCWGYLPQSQSFSNEDATTDWEEWCSGMDGLGALIMLAASLAT